jgi:hypothetical protein
MLPEQVREGVMPICIQKAQISEQITDYFLQFYVTLIPGEFRGRRPILKYITPDYFQILISAPFMITFPRYSTPHAVTSMWLNNRSHHYPHSATMNATSYTTNTWIMGSNSTQGMDMCLLFFLYEYLCCSV